MTNPDRPDELTMDDLERDLPTTAEDVEALRRLRFPPVEDYFAALARLPQPSYEELLARKGPRGEPFEL
jgi:hypothetical protein